MRCSSCAFENPPDARFCERCGSPMVPEKPEAERSRATDLCPTCGAERRPGLQFCEECATPFSEEPPAVVTEPLPVIPVSVPPPAPEAQRPVQPARTVPESATGGGRVCGSCGYLNLATARYCAGCGEALVARAEPSSAQPSAASRVGGILVRVVISVVMAVVSAVATRYLMSYVIGLGLIP